MKAAAADLAALTRLRELRERHAARALAAQRLRCTELAAAVEAADQQRTVFEQSYQLQRDADWQAQLQQPLDFHQLQALQDREANGRARLQALSVARDEAVAAHLEAEQACEQRLGELHQRQRQVEALASLCAQQRRADVRRAEALTDLNSEDIPYHAAHR